MNSVAREDARRQTPGGDASGQTPDASGTPQPYRFEHNWYAVRARRIALVARAKAGDTEAMDDLRTMALHAGVFAVLSVHNQVTIQELQYARWLRGEAITGLPIHVQSVEQVGAWIAAHFSLALCDDLSGATFAEAALAVRGLGPAKATFFAALMGFDFAPCIDTHMARLLGLEKEAKNGIKTMKRYRALLATSPWTHTLEQWHAFLVVKRFALTMHDCFFASVLGPAAIVASP